MQGLWPRSLFGRLVLVLALGLVLAQGLSAWINWAERDRALLRAAGVQPVQRVADIVRLLDPLDAAERARLVKILNTPPQRITLGRTPLAADTDPGVHGRMVATLLRAALGDDRALRVAERDPPAASPSGPPGPQEERRGPDMHERMMGPGGAGPVAPAPMVPVPAPGPARAATAGATPARPC